MSSWIAIRDITAGVRKGDRVTAAQAALWNSMYRVPHCAPEVAATPAAPRVEAPAPVAAPASARPSTRARR